MSWHRIKAFVIRDLKLTFRDKATVFWIIIWPIFWILMTAYVFIPLQLGEPITLDLGVVNYDTSVTAFNGSTFITILNETTYKNVKMFNVKIYSDEDSLKNDLRKGRLDIGIIIPDKFGENLTYGQARIYVFIGASNAYKAQINYIALNSFLQYFNEKTALIKINNITQYIPENTVLPYNESTHSYRYNGSFKDFIKTFLIGIAKPINTSVKEFKPEALTNRSTILGWYTFGAIGMMYLCSGFSIGALTIVGEYERKTLRRILSTPATAYDLLLGRILSGIIILLMSTIIAVLVAVFGTGAQILWSPLNPIHWLVPLMIILISVMTISIGILLSMASKTSRGANNLSTALGLLSAFTTNIWFPKEMMPPLIRFLGDYFPITWSIDVIRNIVVYQASIEEVWTDLIKVITSTIALFMLGVITYNKMIRKYIEE